MLGKWEQGNSNLNSYICLSMFRHEQDLASWRKCWWEPKQCQCSGSPLGIRNRPEKAREWKCGGVRTCTCKNCRIQGPVAHVVMKCVFKRQQWLEAIQGSVRRRESPAGLQCFQLLGVKTSPPDCECWRSNPRILPVASLFSNWWLANSKCSMIFIHKNSLASSIESSHENEKESRLQHVFIPSE